MNINTHFRSFAFAALALGGAAFSSAATVEERLAALETLTAQQKTKITTLEQKLTAVETKTKFMTVTGTDTFFRGTNVYVQKDAGYSAAANATTNGLGNLIIGYNLTRANGNNIRTGSHNFVYGDGLNYVGSHNMIGGVFNGIMGNYSAMLTGKNNELSGSGDRFSVMGTGYGNLLFGQYGLMGTGYLNRNEENYAAIVTGSNNLITRDNVLNRVGNFAAILTGEKARAYADFAAIVSAHNAYATNYGSVIGAGYDVTSTATWHQISE